MKRSLLLFLILLCMIGVLEMSILGNPYNLQKRMVDQINHRINVVNGIVASRNPNDTFNCYIAGETVIYPNIPTFSRNPKLGPGDKVVIEFINGCRETPAILAPEDIREQPETTFEAANNIYVVYKKTSDNKFYLIKINSDDSITAISELSEIYGHNLVRILTDNNNNVYALKEKESTLTYTWHKYNSSGILQASRVMAANELFGFIYNGNLYTMVYNDYRIRKRSLSTLASIETINLTASHRFYYLCFDSDGYLYTYDRDYSTSDAIVKWEIGVGLIEYHEQNIGSLSAWADWSLLGSFIACDYSPFVGAVYSFSTALNANATGWVIDNIPNSQAYGIASTPTYMYILGQNTADNKLIVKKYNASKDLQATIDISEDYIGNKNANAITAYPF